ncbi:MAG TPA: aminopeptidase, partial [Candidatus Sulfotelmatobacter sp.]|nr:aminopeptidase [Candidatus Sulfotelmatobacter sp.]
MALVAALFITGCASQVGYLAKQGTYLIRTSSGARSIDSLLASKDAPHSVRDLLQRVKAIKSFAVTQMGLRDNGNYTRYKVIAADHLVDVVSASDATSFTPYLWQYPFLGKLPYKGFYVATDAKAEADRLRGQGYDVIVRPVDAFSTLGFVRDPVYSFMDGYSPYELASTIIHEQTHATLFLRGQPQFNEELATFVGDEGAFEWLRATYGADSPEYQDALDQTADSATF